MKRRIFVGDLQGCADELQDLLQAVRFDPASDRLYSVGDAVNRGPDSAGAVRLLRQLDATMVLGNHELHLFAVVAGRRTLKGRDTLQGLLDAPDAEELLAWLRSRPLLVCEADLVMVHAGLHPGWVDLEAKAAELATARDAALGADGVESADLSFAISARYCDASGRRPERDWPVPAAPFQPWDDFYEGARTVVFGHWARRGLVHGSRRRGLDTGCVYGQQLSAWIAEEDRVVQVPARRAYCSTGSSGNSSR